MQHFPDIPFVHILSHLVNPAPHLKTIRRTRKQPSYVREEWKTNFSDEELVVLLQIVKYHRL